MITSRGSGPEGPVFKSGDNRPEAAGRSEYRVRFQIVKDFV
jgi:hypothetical protein